MKTFALAASLLVLGSAATAKAGEWEIDSAHSASQFAVKHMMVSTVRGQFGKTTGTVNLDEKDLTRSTVEVAVDVTTIDTREPKRDEHLRSPDFFDAAKFPTLTFKSTRVEKAGKGFKVTGDLTMRGVTRPVVLNVESLTAATKNPWGQTIRGVTATGKLNRKDWGLTWNKALETGGVLVGEEVLLTIDAELVEKAPQPAAAK